MFPVAKLAMLMAAVTANTVSDASPCLALVGEVSMLQMSPPFTDHLTLALGPEEILPHSFLWILALFYYFPVWKLLLLLWTGQQKLQSPDLEESLSADTYTTACMLQWVCWKSMRSNFQCCLCRTYKYQQGIITMHFKCKINVDITVHVFE